MNNKERFTQWLNEQTEIFRKSKPSGATHYVIGKNKIKWYKLEDGFFYKFKRNKQKYSKFPVRLSWDSNVHCVYW